MASDDAAIVASARHVLESAWDAAAGYCVPNAHTYPHLWLWDSCFHSLAWMGVGDDRCVTELAAVFTAQTASGFVPHMRYGRDPGYLRGPREDASCLTQPPVYGIVIDRLAASGYAVPPNVLDAARRALVHLSGQRRDSSGLLAIYHPWESGADDSPRWDSWAGTSRWSRSWFSLVDRRLLRRTVFRDHEAVGSAAFVVCPSAFNGIYAFSCARLGALVGDAELARVATAVGDALDARCWNDAEGLWDDAVTVGGGRTRTIPTLDGVLGALATRDATRANRALDQVLDPDRFGAEFGVRYVPRTHRTYAADSYWRGPAWPQMNYLIWTAANHWGRRDVADAVVDMTVRGVQASGFAEFWNADTGKGLGAIPQTWAAVVAAMR